MTLKDLRKKKHLTQKQMAEYIGIGFSTYQKLEQGSRKPTNYTMKKIKEKFKSFDLNVFFK